MMEVRTTISEGGRIVIPANFRKELNIAIGDELVLKLEDDGLHIITLYDAIKFAQATVKKYNTQNVSLTKELRMMRDEEVRHE